MPQSTILRIYRNPTNAHGHLASIPHLVRHPTTGLPTDLCRLRSPRYTRHPTPRAPHNLCNRPRPLRCVPNLNNEHLIRVLALPLALHPLRPLSPLPRPSLEPEPAALLSAQSRQPGRRRPHLPANGRGHGLHCHADLGCDHALASAVREGERDVEVLGVDDGEDLWNHSVWRTCCSGGAAAVGEG